MRKRIFNRFISIIRSKGFKEGIEIILDKIRLKLNEKKRYSKFLAQEKAYIENLVQIADQEISKFSLLPIFSVVMPVYNVDEKWLRLAIESVRNQIYPHWELCIADDASPCPHIRAVLTEYTLKDSRIKVVFREKNGNISLASNSALELVTGNFIAFLDHDDEIASNALYENAKLINNYPNADYIYSDLDKIDIKGKRFGAFFKPRWSPEYFHACMYTCHLGVFRNTLIREIGGFRSEYNGSQDYDLVLRITEKTKNIYHIPKILYHWRTIRTSAASGSEAKPWAYLAGARALEDMLKRSQYEGSIDINNKFGIYRVRRNIVAKPIISIVILSNKKSAETSLDKASKLLNCINSIKKSTYKDFEIIIVDSFDIGEKDLAKIICGVNIKVVHCLEQFNFSKRVNYGVSQAKGEFILLLNDDIEVIDTDWLNSMLELSQLPEIGAVGAKLLYPSGKLYHVGIVFQNGLPSHPQNGYNGICPGYFNSNIVNKNYLALTGACLMLRLKTFQEIGGMDESLPIHGDIDLCLKLHQAGYRNVFTPYALLIHHGAITQGENNTQTEEINYLTAKWTRYFDTLGQDPYYNPNFLKDSFNFELP